MTRIHIAIAGSLSIAAVSTLGDFVWATWIPEHRAPFGLAHGTLLFLSIGLFLGVLAGRPAGGALGGALIGLSAAGLFYVLAPLVGVSAMFVAWFGVWVALAALYGQLSAQRSDRAEVRGVSTDTRALLSRGVMAGLASGLAFYLISGIWRPFDPEGWDYAVHLAAWTVAYLPGFAALLVGTGQRRSA